MTRPCCVGDRVVRQGAVGLVLAGDVTLVPAVAQGCRPIGPVLTVTKCDDNLVRELDGGPAIDAAHRVLRGASERDRELARASALFLGLETDPFDDAEERHWLVRNILGRERDGGGLYVGERMRPGRRVRFHVRDAVSSAEDLERTLMEAHDGPGAACRGALLFSCLGRGMGLYGVPDHDTRAFHARFPGVPRRGIPLQRRDRARRSADPSPRLHIVVRAAAREARVGARPARMRIAHVTLDGGFPRYGIGLAVCSLAAAQARAGDDVLVLVRAGNAEATPAPVAGVCVVGLERRRAFLGRRRATRREVRNALGEGVDVVHVHTLVRMAHWLLPASARAHAPLVVTAHASDELGPAASPAGGASPARARRHARQALDVLTRADAIVVPSRFMEALVRRCVDRDDIHVVGHGPTDERPVARTAPAEFVVTALARHVHVKGLDLLLEAFAAAWPDDDTARLVLAGDGPGRPSLIARSAALGVSSRVDFPGYVEGAARAALLGRTAVVAVPTRGEYETFGLSALDGRAAGCVVLVGDGGALPERVGGDEASIVGASVAEWTLALRRARADPGRARAARDGAAAVLVENSWDRSARLHRTIYTVGRGRAHGER